jgi:hypothetical protein
MTGCTTQNVEQNVIQHAVTQADVTLGRMHPMVIGMKGVGISLPDKDFVEMKESGIAVLSTEWGMEQDVASARAFLDQAYKAGLKVVMDGGFSASAWGFTDDDWDILPQGKRPVWQKERVQSWIKTLKDHPAIYAWDICNEFGENLPSGAITGNSEWPGSMVTIEQIRQAKADVKAADPTRPILIRMHGWDMGEMPRYVSAVLDNKIADIISLNLYSNYLVEGKLEWPDVIAEGGKYYVDAIKNKIPGTSVWVSLAAFEYLDIFQRPTTADIERDIREALLIKDIEGISFFCWGPVDQWDSQDDWYLPKTGRDIWKEIQWDISAIK